MSLVLGERGVIGSPWWGESPIEMVLNRGLPLKNHLLSARSFISASPVQALGSRIIITVMTGRVIALVSASEEVGLHWLATPG